MQWQPIDTAPKDSKQSFLVYDSKSKVIECVRFMKGILVTTWDHDAFGHATHWMPLPPPPQGA